MNIYQERVRRGQALMAQQGIDVLLLLTPESYHYFTGDFRRQPRAFIPRQGELTAICFASEKEEVKALPGIRRVLTYRSMPEMMAGVVRSLRSPKVPRPRVALEMEFGTPHFLVERFKMANPMVDLVDGRELVMALRKVKDATEQAKMRRACEVASLGMEAALRSIREGVKEVEVAVEAEYTMKKSGAERMAFPIFVNSGYRSLWLHGMATPKRIVRGELVLLDLGPVVEGYGADLTRTVSLGPPGPDQARLHSLYVKMQQTALSAIRPGVTPKDLDQAARRVAQEGGYGAYYVGGIVHGLGLAFEELPIPTIFPEDMVEPLVPGMTLAVGHNVLAVPGIGGVRVEDTVLLREGGIEVLTSFPRELQEVG